MALVDSSADSTFLNLSTAAEARSCRARRGRRPAHHARYDTPPGVFADPRRRTDIPFHPVYGPHPKTLLTARSGPYTLFIERSIKELSWASSANKNRTVGSRS